MSKPKRWKPESGIPFYVITYEILKGFYVAKQTVLYKEFLNKFTKTGLCFRTRKEAEEILRAIKILCRKKEAEEKLRAIKKILKGG